MVLWSTPESIERGEASWLAILETILAVAFYWGIAWAFDTHFHLLMSVLVAPLLLLRSPESIALGVKLFSRYWMNRRKINLVKYIVCSIILFFFWMVISYVFFYDPVVVSKSDYKSFIIHAGSVALFDTLFFWIIISFFSAFSIMIIKKMHEIFLYSDMWALCPSVVCIFIYIYTVLDGIGSNLFNTVWGMFFTSIIIFLFVVNYIMLSSLAFAIGVLARSVFVRVISTVFYIGRGVKNISYNWRSALFVIDSNHRAELVPIFGGAVNGFTIDEMSHPFGRDVRDSDVFFADIAHDVWFLVALFYRWSIKSTCWLYFPLVYLAWPHKGSGVDDRVWLKQLYRGRMEMVRRITGLLVVTSAVWFTFPVADMVELHVTLPQAPGIANLLAFDLGKVGEIPLWQWCGLISAAATFIVWLASEKLQFHLDIAGDWPERAAHWLRLLVRGRSIVTVISLVMSVGYMVLVFPRYYPGGIPEFMRIDVRALPDWLWFIRDLYAPYLP